MAATPSPNFNDQQILAASPVFQNRVRQALISFCINTKDEAVTVAFHRERETFAAAVMNAPDSYKEVVAMAVAAGGPIMQDATQNGTVPLTAANVDTQQALVTDPHITTAISLGYNTYFRTPSS